MSCCNTKARETHTLGQGCQTSKPPGATCSREHTNRPCRLHHGCPLTLLCGHTSDSTCTAMHPCKGTAAPHCFIVWAGSPRLPTIYDPRFTLHCAAPGPRQKAAAKGGRGQPRDCSCYCSQSNGGSGCWMTAQGLHINPSWVACGSQTANWTARP